MNAALSVDMGPLHLDNPVMPASGTFDWFGVRYGGLDVDRLGAVVTKSITLEPQSGNPPQRVAETPAGMLNTIGIPSVGLDVFIEEVLPKYRALSTAVIVSIQAYSPEECGKMAARLDREPRVDAIEINLSCPNLQHGVITAQSAPLTAKTVAAARAATHIPLIAKLSPNVTDITEIAKAAEESGADALCLINTLKGMAIDVNTRRAILGHISGGLSGPAIKPVAMYLVWECYQSVGIPIIGSGGIATAEDAIEFMLAGASAVQVGTATFREPRTMVRIVEGIREYLESEDIESVGELTGQCHQEGSLYTG
jgi:dihydroorotate dehydrogenase (NAD+) catalytic subunit